MSSALVNYGTRALLATPPALRRYRQMKRVRSLANLARYTWKNRKGIARGVRAARAGWQSMRKVLTRTAPNAKNTAEAFHDSAANISHLPKHLYDVPVLFASETASTTNNRLGNTLHFSGIKSCFLFKNTTSSWVTVHLALIQAKQATANLKTDFFRNNESTTDRTLDFTDDHASSLSLRYSCMGINPEKYHILWRARKSLMPVGSTDPVTDVNQKFFWKHDKYTKVKKTITFDTVTATVNTQPFHYVFWIEPTFPDDFPVEDTTELKVSYITETFYRNNK